jgi:membrane fusion protein, multidrug efflux system
LRSEAPIAETRELSGEATRIGIGMKPRNVVIGVALTLALVGGVAYSLGIRSVDDVNALTARLQSGKAMGEAIAWARGLWKTEPAVAQTGNRPAARVVPVEVTVALRKKTPVQIHALGTVTPMASVAIKARLETAIIDVHFADGAMVKQGDLLFTLDGRHIEAQIKEIEALIVSAKAQLAQSQRDLERYADLAAKNAATQVQVNNTQTQVNVWTGAVNSNGAKLENLRVQLSYCTIRAPITGRISAANVKAGNFVRPADIAPLATINQIAPIYVSFTVPQKDLPDVRLAMTEGSASVAVAIPGEAKRAAGRVTMIENTVDPTTGMVIVRATMPNSEETLWPGTLVTADLQLRVENVVTIPSLAVQTGQAGTYVFVIKNNVAEVRQVKVARTVEHESVIETGLAAGEQVATDGQLLLGNGTRVRIRNAKAGA